MPASLLAGLLVALALVAPSRASGHPMGNFSISHYASIHVEPDGVRLRYVLDLAEIPTFQVLHAEGLPAEAENPRVQAYLARAAETLADGLVLDLDGQRLTLRSEASELTFPAGAGGLPTLKLGMLYRARLPRGDASTTGVLTYRDGNYPERAGWKEIVAVAAPGVTLVSSSVPERDRSRELADYPTDPDESPPQALQARVVFARPIPTAAIAGVASPPRTDAERAKSATPRPISQRAREPAGTQPASPTMPVDRAGVTPADRTFTEPANLAPSGRRSPRDAFAALISDRALGPGMLLFALAVAASLGAFHALEPGHGKTVVAAYLVGSRGTAGHALVLGLVVTASHTLGVYLLGVVTLYASRHVMPERLYPWLGATSGILIVFLGVSLLHRQLAAPGALVRRAVLDHAHPHGHDASTPPDPEAAHARGIEHGHDHHHPHHHHVPDGPVSLRALVALGVSGGIVPCPAALVVLLSALSMGRIGLGLLLILAFSLGLAAVLIAIGLFVVCARRLAARYDPVAGNGRLVRHWLPLTSAAVITVSGVVVTLQALSG